MFDSIWFYAVLYLLSVAAILLFFIGASRFEREETDQWRKQHPDDCGLSEAQAVEASAFMTGGPVELIHPEGPEGTPDVTNSYGTNQVTIPTEISPETAEMLKLFLRSGKNTVHKIEVTRDGETQTYTTNAGHMKASNAVRAEEAKRRAIATKQIIDSWYTEDRAADDMGYGSVKSMRQAIKKYCGGTK